MTTPLRPLPTPHRACPASGERAGALQGIARHVSAEGCQFAISGTVPGIGRRLALVVGAKPRITGVVRWVVEDRIGFAFDQALDGEMVTELATHLALLKATRLLPCPEPLPSPPARSGPSDARTTS